MNRMNCEKQDLQKMFFFANQKSSLMR